MRIIRLLKRPAVATISVQAVDITTSICTALMIAHQLGVKAFGIFSLAQGVAAALAIFLLLGTTDIIVRQYIEFPERRETIFGSSLAILGLGTAITVTLSGAVCLALDSSPEVSAYVMFATLTLIANGYSSICNSALIAYGYKHLDFVPTLLSRAVLIIGVGTSAISGELLGIFASYLLSGALLAWSRKRTLSKHLGIKRIRFCRASIVQTLVEGKRLGLANVFHSISARADIFLLETMASTAELGFYAAIYRFASAMQAAGSAIAIAIFPGYLKSHNLGKTNFCSSAIWTLPLLGLASMLALAWLSLPISEVVFGSEFKGTETLTSFILTAAGFQFANIFSSKILTALRLESYLPIAGFVAASVNVTTNLFLIPLYGAQGAAIATLVAEGAVFCMLMTGLVAHRVTRR